MHDIVDGGDDIGVAVFVDGHDDGVAAVDAGVARDALVLAADRRDGREGNLGAFDIGDLDFFQLVLADELGLDAHVCRRRICIDRAGRHEDVFGLDGADDFGQGHIVVDELVFIDFDGNFLVAAAVEFDFRNAVGLLDDVFKVVFCFGINVV